MTRDVKAMQATWDELGKTDPLWAISSFTDQRGNRWEPEAFFRRGTEEINAAMAAIRPYGIPALNRQALDFGCGVGRCTQALAAHFEFVTGLDIAPSMVAKARQYNRFFDRVEYVTTGERPLGSVRDGTFDLVWCTDVIQHVKPAHAFSYLEEFIRILAPGGVIAVQVPHGFTGTTARVLAALNVKNTAARLWSRITGNPVIEYYTIPRPQIERFFAGRSARIVHAADNPRTGVISYRYFVTGNTATQQD